MSSLNKSESSKATMPSIVGMGTDSKSNQKVYDDWATRYDRDIRAWGYNLPEKAAELLVKHLPLDKKLRLLDAGAGDGLSGMALRQAGLDCYMVGSDVSPEMLKIASERSGCYNETQIQDLNQPLNDMENDTFDAVNCIGTLTYVDPKSGTLAEFVRITKPGGLVCYSNRTDKLNHWSEVEQSLIEAKKWQLVEKIGPIPYLPDNPEYASKVEVMLCLYRVL